MKSQPVAGRTEHTSVVTGMRGGLGRTFLTAFLLLAIVPMSAISFIAIRRTRQDMRLELDAKLTAVAALKATQIEQWFEERRQYLALIAAHPDVSRVTSDFLSSPSNALARAELLDLLDYWIELSPDMMALWISPGPGKPPLVEVGTPIPARVQEFVCETPVAGGAGYLGGFLGPATLNEMVSRSAGLGQTGEIYLVNREGRALSGLAYPVRAENALHSVGISAALEGKNGSGLYQNYAGEPVVGAYRWLPEPGIAVLAEQSQAEAFAREDALAAMLIASTLAASLLTTLLAAVVTRRFTQPIVQLTKNAVRIAGGDLSQSVPVTRRDEIGILGRAFNIMTAELRTLYEGLEQKVAERTRQYEEANDQLRYQTIQLAVSAQVGRVITSILELDPLLKRIVELILHWYFQQFQLAFVGIFLVDETRQWTELKASEGTCPEHIRPKMRVDDGDLVAEAVANGEAHSLCSRSAGRGGCSELAIPLQIRQRVIGVLYLYSPVPGVFSSADIGVLRGLGDQISVAIENARAYELEREAARQLRETEQMRRRFLGHMSHEFREPLNRIIGFSRLILKGLDGPISEQQRRDLESVHANGQHLLGLINDLLDVAKIEAGLMELDFREVDLGEIINSVMATTSALVRDKDVQLRQEIHPGLPAVEADGVRVRQVLLKLLSNAAKFTDHGSIVVRAWPNGNSVKVAVADTGIGISAEDQEGVFERFEQGGTGASHPPGIGLGLTLCKEFVEMHGGRIWVESEEGIGSTFTFTLPIRGNVRDVKPEYQIDYRDP